MNRRNVLTIVRKELLETLRDRRTLVAMIGIPLLLYPALFVIITQVVTLQQAKMERQISRIALHETAPTLLRQWLSGLEQVELIDSADPEAAVRLGQAHAAVTAGPDLPASLETRVSGEVVIDFDGTEPASRHAMERVRDALEEQFDRILEERLAEAGLPRAYIEPIRIESANIATAEKRTGSFLAGLLPMLLVVMVGVGAFYPAVDLTAGEKERGTFETLLSTPTSKLDIVTGKFITVFALAMFTGLLNLGSMTLSLAYQLVQLPENAGASIFSFDHVSIADFGLILLALIPLAFFICALMMAIAVFARDFKEAQNFVTPFYLLILVPGMIASMPGVELSAATELIPIANVALLFKAILTEKASAEAYLTVFICTSVYALLALVFAAWLFQSEQVILHEDKGFALSLRRDDFPPRSAPTIGFSLGVFALVMLILYYPATYFQTREIISGLFITQWVLMAAPVLVLLWWVRIDLRSALFLRAPRPGALLAGLLLTAGGFVLVVQIGLWQSWILPESESIKRMMEELFAAQEGRSLLLMLLAIAVSPAVCEEIVFRGAILSGVRTKLGFGASVLLVGVLFGLFHLSVYRIVPTAAMGIVITYAVLRSGSIFTGMMMHFLNNAIGVLAATKNLPQTSLDWFERIEIQGQIPWPALAGAAAAIAAGVILMERLGGRTSATGDVNESAAGSPSARPGP